MRQPLEPETLKSFKSMSAATPRQVAAALGVSESSVKRWCDQGALATVRTPGGHRRIPVAAVLALSREGGPVLARPSALSTEEDGPARDLRAARRALLRALLADDEGAAREVLEEQRRASSGFDTVADELIAPVLEEIGDRWARGQLEIYEERRACTLLHACLHALGDDLPRVAPSAPRALGGTLEGDPFTLATTLAELVLRERGFAARSLGSWLPASTLARAVRDQRPSLVWLSINHVADARRIEADVAQVERAARAVGAPLVVGGRALDAALRRKIRYSAFCDGMVQLGAFAETHR